MNVCDNNSNLCSVDMSLKWLTSGEDSRICAAGTDLSEVLLDFDLTEDLLELFGVLVVASMVVF